MATFAVMIIKYLLINEVPVFLFFIRIKAVLRNPNMEVINKIELVNMKLIVFVK